jgi:hypothetical protein
MPTIQPLPPDLAGDLEVADYWAEFGQRAMEIEADLAGLGAEIIEVRGNLLTLVGTVAAADVHRKFSAISWSLTTDNFGNGGIGEIKSRWENPGQLEGWISGEQRTNATDFKVYASHPDRQGLNYLALHETAHVTELGIETWKRCWNEHRDLGGNRNNYPYTAPWRMNEKIANAIVRSVCARLGLPLLEPSVGYPN